MRRVRAATAVSGSAIDTLAANGVKRIYSVRKNLSVKFLILSRLVELRGVEPLTSSVQRRRSPI